MSRTKTIFFDLLHLVLNFYKDRFNNKKVFLEGVRSPKRDRKRAEHTETQCSALESQDSSRIVILLHGEVAKYFSR